MRVHRVVVLSLVATVLLLDLDGPEHEQECRFAEHEYDFRKKSCSPYAGTFTIAFCRKTQLETLLCPRGGQRRADFSMDALHCAASLARIVWDFSKMVC